MVGGSMEPISTAALAALIIASRGGAEELGKEAGRSTWSGLGKLRSLVLGKFRGNADAARALAAAEQNPANDTAIAQLRGPVRVCPVLQFGFGIFRTSAQIRGSHFL
jgi:hypothetical protein